ncbi:hypothetical protein P4S72_20005 [Vibrio sp. PP-XX7]
MPIRNHPTRRTAAAMSSSAARHSMRFNVTYQNNLCKLEGLAAERTGYGTTTDSNLEVD